MEPIRLVHWNAAEAEERAAQLRAAGYEVAHEMLNNAALRELREDPPRAVVVDLSRLPSHGRDVALAIRQYQTTRHVPLLFVGGDAEKVARIKQLLPDAIYTTWGKIRSALRRAIARPPVNPVVPSSLLAGYLGTPLAKKLGIRANSLLVLLDAPDGFENTIGELPERVTLRRQAGKCPPPGPRRPAPGGSQRHLTIWFTKSSKDLARRIKSVAAAAGKSGLWIVWPKKTSGMPTDLSQSEVRRVGLAAGLVDY